MKKIIIIGGGLSGLVTSIALAKEGISSSIIEKKRYPFHRVCGEYISNETIPFLTRLGIFPEQFNPSRIQRLQLTSVSGNAVILPLDLGGFGISRYSLDNFLFEKASEAGVEFLLDTEAEKVSFADDRFEIKTNRQIIEGDIVIGSFGKRSKLDVAMDRSFLKKRSPYVGVKYHLRTAHPADLIGLHNFKDGYCGISNIEDGKTNLCYLTHRNNIKTHGSVSEMERAVLFRNPFLKRIFEESDFLFNKPETINEISFETKGPVSNHILMTGDAAGMITPLCGNGMAMAIHSAAVLSHLLKQYCHSTGADRDQLEKHYAIAWKSIFQRRLWIGRQIQRLFGSERASDFAVALARNSKPVADFLVRKTHGAPF